MRGRKPETIVPGSSPVTAVPRPPSYLSRDAKTEWRKIAPILINDRKILTEADIPSLENYVIAVATMRHSHRDIQIHGLVLASGKRNPASTILIQAQQQMLRAAGELGLTPVSRSRPAMIEDDSDDDDNPLTVR